MQITIDNTEYMTRVEAAIRRDMPVSEPRILAVVLKDSDERTDGSYWEQRFIVLFERDIDNLKADYNTVMVCINSHGESMCVNGIYRIKTLDMAMDNMLERAGIKFPATCNICGDTLPEDQVCERLHGQGAPTMDDD